MFVLGVCACLDFSNYECLQRVFGGLHNFNWTAHLAEPLTGGDFTLKFTHRNIVEHTRPIPYDASAEQMQIFLQELQELHMVHVTKSNKITYDYKHLSHMPYGEVGACDSYVVARTYILSFIHLLH